MVDAADRAPSILAIERELAAGDGSTYERHLTDNAIVIVPGAVLDKPATVAAMNQSAGWDELAMSEEQVIALGEDALALSYKFAGRRGESEYAAFLSSVYVRSGGEWKLSLHQQTPLPEGD